MYYEKTMQEGNVFISAPFLADRMLQSLKMICGFRIGQYFLTRWNLW